MRCKRMRTLVDRERLRGRDRCESRHPNWHGVRCERMESDHVVHNAEGETFEWVQFLPIKPQPEFRG